MKTARKVAETTEAPFSSRDWLETQNRGGTGGMGDSMLTENWDFVSKRGKGRNIPGGVDDLTTWWGVPDTEGVPDDLNEARSLDGLGDHPPDAESRS